MDIYSYIKQDHRHISHLMESLLLTQSIARRKMLFDEIKSELSLHSETEKATFYNVLERHSSTCSAVKHAEKEHQQITDYLSELSRISISNDNWLERFALFKQALQQHVEEEENRMFEKARRILSRQASVELAMEMDALKRQIPKLAA
jgi:hemerythrin-like domain-containing protein